LTQAKLGTLVKLGVGPNHVALLRKDFLENIWVTVSRKIGNICWEPSKS
jgi:hypothetical protein